MKRGVLFVSLFLFASLAAALEAPIHTSGGQAVNFQPLSFEQRTLAEGGINNYGHISRQLPGYIKSFLGNELIRAHVRLRDGSVVIVSVYSSGGEVSNTDVLGLVDSQGDSLFRRETSFTRGADKISYTAALYLDQETVEKIAYSPNPQAEFVNQWGRGIKYEGLTFTGGLRTFLLNLGIYFYSFFVPRGPTTVTTEGRICPIEEEDYSHCVSGSKTITAAYSVSSEKFEALCDDLKSSSTASPNLAKTDCAFSYKYCVDAATKVDKEKCECECTVTLKDLTVDLSVSQDLPSWGGGGYGNSTAGQKKEWDRFLEKLKAHEDGHSKICRDGVAKVKAKVDSPSKKATAKTCKAACDAAAAELDKTASDSFSEGVGEVDAENEAYDTNTNHGETQGATLDCNVK